MNYTVEKSDQYTLIRTDLTTLDEEHTVKLAEKIYAETEEGSKYVIFNMKEVTSCNADATRKLIEVGQQLQVNGGLLIVTEAPEPFTRLFSKADITFIPTDDEAIDFVFMDHLEKQFLNMDDNEDKA